MTLINLSPHFYEAQACEVTPVFFIASACYFEIFSQSRDGRLDKSLRENTRGATYAAKNLCPCIDDRWSTTIRA